MADVTEEELGGDREERQRGEASRDAGEWRKGFSARRSEHDDSPEKRARLALGREESRIASEMWEVARTDPRMPIDLLLTLLVAAAEAGGRTGDRAIDALRELSAKDRSLRFSFARNFRRDAGLLRCLYDELFADGYMSLAPMHWAWESETVAIGVEVRPVSPSLLPRHRLKLCVDALRQTAKPLRCVLLLSTDPLGRRQAPRRSAKEWLGVLLWSDLEPRLRELSPAGEEEALRWSRLLDEAQELGRGRGPSST